MEMEEKKFRNTVEFEVSGDYALFSDILTRPGGEKSSTMLPSYEALKGILKSVYFKPVLIWVIDSVRVVNPIQTYRKGIRPIKYGGGNDLAYCTYLRNVRYQVRAHFIWNENRPELVNDRIEHKHHNIAKRMIERGGRRNVFLGTSECMGYVEPCVFGEGNGEYDNTGEISFGLLYHGLTYPDEALLEEDKDKLTVRFSNITMKNGIVDFLMPEECIVKRHIKKMGIKPFGKEYQNFSGLEEFLGGDEFELDR